MEQIIIHYKADEMPTYVREQISLEVCSLFLPASFVSAPDRLTGIVSIQDGVSLLELQAIRAEDALRGAANLLKGIRQAENHGIFLGTYYFHPKYMYYYEGEHMIRILYVPYLYHTEKQTWGALTECISELKTHVKEEAAGYLELFMRDMTQYQTISYGLIRRAERLIEESSANHL